MVREIRFGGAAYDEVLKARDRHLRRPLGLRLGGDDTRNDASQRHFVLERNGVLAGGLIASVDAPSARLRQMWIDDSMRGRGAGRFLLREVLDVLAGVGVRDFTLHARVSAAGFYRKCGFVEEGEAFGELGIPHIRMRLRAGQGAASLQTGREDATDAT